MKYTPNQKPKSIRLAADRIELITKALTHHAARVSTAKPAEARQARIFRDALPKTMPYELLCFPTEWEMLSRALRPEGSSPLPGTDAARMYALYTRLRKTFVFETEGDQARLRQAKRAGFRRLGKMAPAVEAFEIRPRPKTGGYDMRSGRRVK